MNKGMSRAAGLAAVLMLAACASTGTGPKIDATKADGQVSAARLIVYRAKATIFGNGESILRLDGAQTCWLGEGEALIKDLQPGSHTLVVDTPMTAGTSVLTISTEIGKTTYVSVSPNAKRIAAGMVFGFIGHLASADNETPRGGDTFLELVSEDTAKKEMIDLSRCRS